MHDTDLKSPGTTANARGQGSDPTACSSKPRSGVGAEAGDGVTRDRGSDATEAWAASAVPCSAEGRR